MTENLRLFKASCEQVGDLITSYLNGHSSSCRIITPKTSSTSHKALWYPTADFYTQRQTDGAPGNEFSLGPCLERQQENIAYT